MTKQVDVTEALLKEYKDKELVHFLAQKMRIILSATPAEGESYEASLAQRIEAIGDTVLPILFAVDKRMNGDSNEPNIVV